MLEKKVIDESSKWTGYLEKASGAQLENLTANAGRNNYTIFAEWYNHYWGENYQAQPWCGVFVSVMFYHALGKDIQSHIMPQFAYCPTGVNQFKNLGNWYTSAPRSGDVIFFKDGSGTAYHVGIVEKTDDKSVYTIEGNTSNVAEVVANGGVVAKKSYLLSNQKIMGYGRPDYQKYENGDELTMTQYEQLLEQINALSDKLNTLEATIDSLANPMIYNYVDENMPDWARPVIKQLVETGILKGETADGELRLRYEDLRYYMTNYRAGVYDDVLSKNGMKKTK